MIRVQLRPVGQQQNSTIFRPMYATNQIGAVQANAWQAPIGPVGGAFTTLGQTNVPTSQAFTTGGQLQTSGIQGSLAQSYHVPTTQLTSIPLTQATMAYPWQTLQPSIYAQAFNQAMVPGFLPTAQGLAQAGIVQGVSHNIVQPFIDIAETNSEVVLTYDLPFVDQNNLSLSVSHDSVTLQANSGQGVFYRTVSLPTDVFPESCEAILTNDILEIRMPKASQSRRKVNVNQQQIQQTQQTQTV